MVTAAQPTIRAGDARARRACLRAGSIAIALAASVEPSLACAQDAPSGDSAPTVDPSAEAKQQYAAGVDAYAARRYVEAALHFEAAAANRPHAAALYNAALAWEQANRPERAADDYGRALSVPGLSAAQLQNAKGREETLEQTMGTLDVTAPAGWRVQLDANTEAPAPTQLHAAPGVHQLTVVAPDAPIRHRDVTLELGKVSKVDVAVEPPASATSPPAAAPSATSSPPPAPSGPGPEPWWSARRGIGVGAAGVGVGMLLGGVVFGTSALSARDAYDAAPSRAGYDHANALATWSDAAFIAGAVFAAGGAALVLWPAPDRSASAAARARPAEPTGLALRLVPTLGGALVRGAF